MNYLLILSFSVLSVLIIVWFVRDKTEEAPSETPVVTEVDLEPGQEVATFGSGCFWCMEAVFQETEGVISAISGYAGGQEVNPTYKDVYTQQTSHREAVQVFYDPTLISYEEILSIFWRSIDPTDEGGQFVDRGFSYTAAIFYHNEEQKSQAELSKVALADSGRFEAEIVTPILPFTTFYKAEEYHQDYYLKSAQSYRQYESNSGREEFKEQVWQEILKEKQQ